MTVDQRRIESIVAEVLERLQAGAAPAPTTPRPPAAAAALPLGIHPDLDSAVAAARAAFEAYERVPLETRNQVIAAARETLAASARTLAEVAVEETGLGRVE